MDTARRMLTETRVRGRRVALRLGATWPGLTPDPDLRVLVLGALALGGTTWAFSDVPGSVWARVTAVTGLLGAAGAVAVRRDLGRLLHADRLTLAYGAVCGVAIYAAAWVLTRWAPATAQARELYAVPAAVPPLLLAVTLPVVVAGEELIWRVAVTRLLASRFPLWAAVVAGAALCGAAHAASGTWLLPVAAAAAGLCWGLLFGATHSLTVTLVSHLVFDVLALIALPLA